MTHQANHAKVFGLQVTQQGRGFSQNQSARRHPSGELVIVSRWWSSPLVVVCFLIGLVVVISVPVVQLNATVEADRLAIAVAVVLLATIPIALIFNRTRWHVRNGYLRIHHGPIPWPGGKRNIALHEAAGFDVVIKIVGHNRSERIVHMYLRDGMVIPIYKIPALISRSHADIICRILGRFVA